MIFIISILLTTGMVLAAPTSSMSPSTSAASAAMPSSTSATSGWSSPALGPSTAKSASSSSSSTFITVPSPTYAYTTTTIYIPQSSPSTVTLSGSGVTRTVEIGLPVKTIHSTSYWTTATASTTTVYHSSSPTATVVAYVPYQYTTVTSSRKQTATNTATSAGSSPTALVTVTVPIKSFAASCSNIGIKGSVITGTCPNKSGGTKKSTLDLSPYISNVNTRLTHGAKFQNSCQTISIESGDDGLLDQLKAYCQ